MDLLQTIATIALLTLVVYFAAVNYINWGKPDLLKTEGTLEVKSNSKSDSNSKSESESESKLEPEPKINSIEAGIRSQLGITNKLPVEPIGNDYNVGTHSRTTVGGPVGDGNGPNLTQRAVYNEEAKGVVPSNHDLFEKTADFSSDVTNINQFYANNPDIFDRSVGTAHVPNVAEWEQASKQMFHAMEQKGGGCSINPSNFEHNFTQL